VTFELRATHATHPAVGIVTVISNGTLKVLLGGVKGVNGLDHGAPLSVEPETVCGKKNWPIISTDWLFVDAV